ncbi:recombinase family protein [Dysgonomonas termitidis]|uniref:Recombinase family protein n=1 Tax=Dysgonomonas termitidis TaxID=1516126 RepID=A0ABV9KU36_9BACT
MIYGYLRVSSDKQDVESQKIGVEKKAEELHTSIDEWIKDEGVSGVKDYNKRHLGQLMKKARAGDIIIVSEISRLARSVFMLFRIVEFCIENDIIIYSVKDSISTIKKGDLTGIMMVFCFGIAAQIEREMIVKRTVEGLERCRRNGVILGRPPGSKGSNSKLRGKETLIREYRQAGLTAPQIARMLGVHKETLRRYCIENNIDIGFGYGDFKNKISNRYQLKGEMSSLFLDSHRELIRSLITDGLTHKYIVEKLKEQGYEYSPSSFSQWLKKNADLKELLESTQKALRLVRNANSGSQKQYYKF